MGGVVWQGVTLWVGACDRTSRGMASVPSVGTVGRACESAHARPTWHLMRSSEGTKCTGECCTLSVGSSSTRPPASTVSRDLAASFLHLCKEELKRHEQEASRFQPPVTVPASHRPEGHPNQRVPGDQRSPENVTASSRLLPSLSQCERTVTREETEGDEVGDQQSSGTFLPPFHRHRSVINKDSDLHILSLQSAENCRCKS